MEKGGEIARRTHIAVGGGLCSLLAGSVRCCSLFDCSARAAVILEGANGEAGGKSSRAATKWTRSARGRGAGLCRL